MKKLSTPNTSIMYVTYFFTNFYSGMKSDPILENECPLVFLKLKLGCLLPALVTVFLTASPFTDLIQCISLTFITYSTSFLKTVVIVWLNPFPPAKSCVVSAGHTSGHRGHFVLLMLKPCWTAPG